MRTGGAGDDYLVGGAGNDTLSGGTSADVFTHNAASEGGDTIMDFPQGTDKIDLAEIERDVLSFQAEPRRASQPTPSIGTNQAATQLFKSMSTGTPPPVSRLLYWAPGWPEGSGFRSRGPGRRSTEAAWRDAVMERIPSRDPVPQTN